MQFSKDDAVGKGMNAELAAQLFQMFATGQDNLIAKAGGGQTNGTPITANFARFATVATNADSGKLKPATNGAAIIVKNDGNHTLAIFPQENEKMNGTKNASFTVNAQQACMFICFGTTGEWHTLASA